MNHKIASFAIVWLFMTLTGVGRVWADSPAADVVPAVPATVPLAKPASSSPPIATPPVGASKGTHSISSATLNSGTLLLNSTDSSSDRTSEQAVGARLKSSYPNLQVLSVTRLPISGKPVFEFLASGMVGYTDENVNYVLLGGNLITGSGSTLVNVSLERAKASATNLVRSLPIDQAIREVYGKGERTLLVFADPDCPFCQQFEQDLQKNGDQLNVTVYTFLYPMVDLHPDADRQARYIACSSDPSKTWREWMARPDNWNSFAALHPGPDNCEKARIVDVALNIGRSLQMSSTPTLLFRNGMTLARRPSVEELKKGLDYVEAHPDEVHSLNPLSAAVPTMSPTSVP